MKNIKALALAFVVTLALSKSGVLASNTAPWHINNVKVGGADASVYTSAARTKVKEGNQTLTDITQSTKMKTMLQYYNEALNEWKIGSTYWGELTGGKTYTYPSDGVTGFYPALMLGDYRARIAQSSWHLTDGTISAIYSAGNE